jgi:hypothetical protein
MENSASHAVESGSSGLPITTTEKVSAFLFFCLMLCIVIVLSLYFPHYRILQI